jgi:TonB family protein
LFEFTIPTESAPQSPRSLAASIAVHGLAILLLFAIRFSGVARLPAAPEHFTLIAPLRETPIMPPPVRTPRLREFRPLPPAPARFALAPVPVLAAPAIEIPKPVLPEIPRAPEIPRVAATVSIPVVKPAGFSETKPAAPLPAPKPVVKAAGFESSETSTTGPAHGALTALGSFESAHLAEGSPARNAAARPGGFSDASTDPPSAARRNTITSAAFGDTTVEKGAITSRQTAAAARLTPVEILSKPKPLYTADARAKNIEGEVLVEVRFDSSGDVRVLRVVRGLGHGLDETAVAAAQGIRFRPATRDGAVVDSTALVHIVFQLAN